MKSLGGGLLKIAPMAATASALSGLEPRAF
jgi:hypothetical protein